MNSRDIAEIFRTCLGATQSAIEVDLFAAELTRANLDLVAAALAEARVIAALAGPPIHPRDAIMSLYTAKLAELAQLFPVFFVFESAFRAFTSARLAIAYGDDQWWAPVRDALERNHNLRSLQRLGKRPATRDVVDTVAHLLRGMGPGAAGVASSYDLLEGGTLAHVERLIYSHWTIIDQGLRHPLARPPLTASSFRNLFKIVRLARNDTYHHRSVQHRPRLVTTSELLLDMLDISLDARMTALAKIQPPPLTFSIPVAPRHG
ncbi:MAG: hypothetical protein RL367_916 [Pseudomonadota bacterium]